VTRTATVHLMMIRLTSAQPSGHAHSFTLLT
jgi:hypothetical protein